MIIIITIIIIIIIINNMTFGMGMGMARHVTFYLIVHFCIQDKNNHNNGTPKEQQVAVTF